MWMRIGLYTTKFASIGHFDTGYELEFSKGFSHFSVLLTFVSPVKKKSLYIIINLY